ncbi:S8 family serine peptidase [Plectonema radiosum NIES-515]|uniref:S8 family serine peptidase n=1 Tax=Plectonema radiosum NIES-515 TaxID=2986073 RepID=A0ABT3B458_9CYAN|nr:S8 family peptidase [Plectonema radiosum]MCV3216152.1 S8 family serine peptidase [Plectonema radiosum NIES-515]
MESDSNYYDKKLNFTPVSPVDSFNQKDDYNWSYGCHSSFNSATNDVQMLDSSTTAYSESYNYIDGYGLINAADAVSKAAGQKTFADVPNLGGNNWGADLVKAPEAWAKGYTGKGVVVAVVDTGVDRNHDDLKDNIWTNTKEIAGNGIDDDGNGYVDDVNGWNFDGNDNNTLDVAGHGTHVSGTIASEKNDFGVTGIAYDAKIMPVKVLNDSGSGSYDAIAQGIRYAADNGANVINLSLGGDYPNSVLESALKYASSKGAIVVMAAGNDSGLQPGYPARYANETGIAVGAVDKENNLASFSNLAGFNPLTYVTAPGVDIYSTLPGNKYANYSGTSMATPHVAGVVALMLSANPNLTDAQVRQILQDTSGNSTQATNSNFSLSSTTQSDRLIANISNTSFQSSPEIADDFLPSFNSGIESDSRNLFPTYKPATFSFTDSYIKDNKMLFPELQLQSQYSQDIFGINIHTDALVENILKQPKTQIEEYQDWLFDINSQIV